MKSIKIGLAQINPTIGDTIGNAEKIIEYLKRGRDDGVDVIAFPEMVTIGYPAQDLLFRSEIIESNLESLERIKHYTQGYLAVVVGYCQPAMDSSKWRIDRQHLYNAYVVYQDGKIIGRGEKICLPNYGVFDDFRYFIPGKNAKIFNLNGIKLGVEVCEDLWYTNDEEEHPIYPLRPTKSLTEQGVDFILVINASPYHAGKELIKKNLVKKQAVDNHVPIFYVNMWGGNDKIIFDGNSFASDKLGNIIAYGKSFCDDLVICDLDLVSKIGILIPETIYHKEENLFNALVLGKRDYHSKCGISRSVVGVSGGIDSATVLAIDVHAIGSENVLAIISPSRYTSKETLEDAVSVCVHLNVKYKIIPIEEQDENGEWCGVIPEKNRRYVKYMSEPNNPVVFENQQAIDRMSILRSIANEENRLISGTGNKSELAMGYATVCGDLQADILVIGDLYKRDVYSVALYINHHYQKEIIPESIINRTPSAELSEDQVDPFNYERLDEYIQMKIESYLSDIEIIRSIPKDNIPFTQEEINHYSKLIDQNEHKRFKSGYILKVSPVAFGEDRRINTAKKITLWDNKI